VQKISQIGKTTFIEKQSSKS